MKYVIAMVCLVALANAALTPPIPKSRSERPANPLLKSVGSSAQFITYPNMQITYPYTGANGMTDGNGNWKYCWNSNPSQALSDCLNWCLAQSNCAGVTQDDYNDDDFYFPVTTTSWDQVKCVNGLSFWEK